MLVKDITDIIEDFAPLTYQESYDNAGLQVGDLNVEVTGILIALDVTEPVLCEAIARGCTMIVAHHPLIFSGLKRITGRNYVERIVQRAIKHDINIYAAHTNLDNVRNGVNAVIAAKLGLRHTAVLAPTPHTLSKLYTYAPPAIAGQVRESLFAAGAGHIGNYSECSFNVAGTGTFKPGPEANPTIGEAGGPRNRQEEIKIEVLVPKHKETAILRALFSSHTYEQVAYELVALQNANQELGAGMVGILAEPMPELQFLNLVKRQMQTGCIRHTALTGKPVQCVAVCGGSGSFLLNDAIRAKADIFITADYKYHQFFDAEGKIIIADIGHYESEQYTGEIFQALIKKKFPNFAILLSNLITNPVKYFC
jgi:dinuclear metal center YbgI/SA1388 family protein